MTIGLHIFTECNSIGELQKWNQEHYLIVASQVLSVYFAFNFVIKLNDLQLITHFGPEIVFINLQFT